MEHTQAKRIGYIDTAKGWLMLLVVVGHILIVLNPGYDRLPLTAVQECISSFHMPAFFVIHGLLMGKSGTDTPWKDILIKRIRTMVVPYVFFETLGMVCRRLLYGQSWQTGIYNLLSVRCNVGADWFLPALLMGSVLATAWHKYGNRSWGWVSAAAAWLLAISLPRTQPGIVLTRGLLGYGFIVLGMLLPQRLFLPEKRQAVWFAVFSGVVAVCAVINLKFGGNDFYSGMVGNLVTLLLGGVCGSGWVLLLAKWSDCGLLRTLGRASLPVMGTHQLVIYALTAWISRMRGGSILWGVVLALAIAGFEGIFVPVTNGFVPWLVGNRAGFPPAGKTSAKGKRSLKGVLLWAMVPVVLLTLLGLEAHRCATQPETVRYSLTTDLDCPIRIVQLSDLHGHRFGEDNSELVRLVREENPDLILMTGDMLDKSQPGAEAAQELIAALKDIAPIYYCYGNHEKHWETLHGTSLAPGLQAAGARVLDVEYEDITIKGQPLRIGGYHGYCRQPHMFPVTGEQLRKELEFAESFEQTERYRILMCHIPTAWLDWGYIHQYPVDLVLCGHYHGGLVQIPGIGGVIAPYVGLFPEYTEGLYQGEKANCVLSAGLGSNPGLPRLFNPPQVVVVDLVPRETP